MATANNTVLRQHRHERGFVIIDNDVADDIRLSFAARGIHHYMLTRPTDWRFSADRIARASSGEGRQRVQRALRELEAAGYVRRDVVSGPGGKLSTVVTVSDRANTEWAALGADRITKRSEAAKRSEAVKQDSQPAETDVFPGHTGGQKTTSGENTPDNHPDLPAETDVSPVRTEGRSPAPGDRTPVTDTTHPIQIPNTVIQEAFSVETSTHTRHGRTAREDENTEPADDSAATDVADPETVCDPNPQQPDNPEPSIDDVNQAMAAVRDALPETPRNCLTKRPGDIARVRVAVVAALTRRCTKTQIRNAVTASRINTETVAPAGFIVDALTDIHPPAAPGNSQVMDELAAVKSRAASGTSRKSGIAAAAAAIKPSTTKTEPDTSAFDELVKLTS